MQFGELIATSTCEVATTTDCSYYLALPTTTPFFDVQDGSLIFGIGVMIFLMLLMIVAFIFNSLGGRHIRNRSL